MLVFAVFKGFLLIPVIIMHQFIICFIRLIVVKKLLFIAFNAKILSS